MILRSIITGAFVFFYSVASSQDRSVNELQKVQDIRKKYITKEVKPGEYFGSKSLYVDPFVGTGGHGHTYPGAAAPFGMMQLSPDTRYEGWDGCSGYHYSDSIIYGFSHTHLSGVGVPDYCDLLIVPQSGIPKITPGYLDPKGYGDRFTHEQENASPGYYEVKLIDQQINVRLTVSERAGMHEYNFLDKSGKKFILIDLDHRDKVLNAYMTAGKTKRSVSGLRVSQSWANNQYFYFYLETSVPYQSSKKITKNGQHKLLLTFPEKTQQVRVKVGMSAVDEEGAIRNLETEVPDWDFDNLRAQTTKKWNTELGKVDFKTRDNDVMINFYTALYHTYLCPNLFSDVDGRYRGRDNSIHRLDDSISPQYTVFSLWDTYRATHPLFTITQQKRTLDFIKTFLRQFKDGGDLPVWELAGNETECMIGYHSVSVIADAYIKGIKGFHTGDALNAMITTSNLDELGKLDYLRDGFINSGIEPESVSKTLEYAYDDFCIAQFAKFIDQPGVHDEYLKRSFNFINLYDPETKFMRARRSGIWFSPFEPSEVNFNYTEANSWQYSLYAPHAVGVLSNLMGGKDSLETWLDHLFTTESNLSGRHQVDITGLIGQYAHGNEPSHHMAYLYNYTNSSQKTAFYLDRIQKEMYSPTPEGLSGNEDCGQMSAWYVLSAMGIYQIAPGNPIYEIGRPLMNEVSIEIENGNKLVLKAINNSKENKYVQEVRLNGKTIYRNYLHHSELISGGEIVFIMGDKPNLERDKFAETPTISKTSENFVPVAFFKNTSPLFDDHIDIELDMVNIPSELKNFRIEYRLNDENWKVYTSSFSIMKTTVIEARITAEDDSKTRYYSPVIKNRFVKRDTGVSLVLNSKYENQYAAGGPMALIDGMIGGNEFRTGDYQGFWAQNLVAEVSFTESRKLKEVGLSCIQDMKSWIFYPSEIQIEVSYDGTSFEKLPTIFSVKNEIQDNMVLLHQIPLYDEYVGPTNHDFVQVIKNDKPVQKIRITAKNFGKCPKWHLGAGNDTWLFADEIIFR
ncbi:MAG: GH92 family glycosyl hydrolase [Flavobacteriia bacterium]